MIKKMLVPMLVALSISSVNVFADTNTSLTQSKENLVGQTYEVVKKPHQFFALPNSYFEDENGVEREEFKEDKAGQESINRLVTKTKDKYEIALAHEDGKYTYLDSANSNKEVESKFKEESRKHQSFAAMPVILNNSGQVVYSKKSMGRIVKYKNGQPAGFKYITNIYSSPNLTNEFTYVNAGYVDDVPIIEDRGNAAKIEIAGYEGWVNKDKASGNYDLVVVPLNQAKNPSYYIVKDGELKHYISTNLVDTSEGGYFVTIGPAPDFLKSNVKYYSYDGQYFYRDLSTLIGDLQNGNHNNSVNVNNKFYAYYMYLPFRSKTTFTADELNTFINRKTKPNSKLRGTGQAFINAQNKYGSNALLMLGLAANESAWGTSKIALEKNNLFGLNAVDSSPGQSANYFKSAEQCIDEFAKYYISRGYSDPEDWRYFGGYLGNKESGANVQYASDPFWGEKAGQYAYIIDYWTSGKGIAGLEDFNHYQLGVFTKSGTVKNKDKVSLYDVKNMNTDNVEKIGATTVVLNRNKVDYYGNSSYVINPVVTEPVIKNGKPTTFSGDYNWKENGYISASDIKFINTGKYSTEPVGKWKDVNGTWYYEVLGKNATGWHYIDGYWYHFDSNGKMQTGWQEIGGYWYYLRSNGTMRIGWEKINGEWYYFESNGVMQTGWQEIGGHWYYFRSNGTMRIGWEKINREWYYFESNGVMQTGWQKINNTWYYFRSSGIMRIGWEKFPEGWYYFDNNGAMVTGSRKINNVMYYFENSGLMRE
ncbi:glucosaminidase domain-containing protein [Clostridium sp.]|uniref:glucosaminidase domain-containing protein n=1 Tax=Clostridium sp. TaxID=1506 RepID=UPI00261ECDD6|nr:glucosaminidase domain-containing protein [Clostridium sp.]